MPYLIKLTKKCLECDISDDYEDFREYGAKNTEVEDERLRLFLAAALTEGLVESFSKKTPATMEA